MLGQEASWKGNIVSFLAWLCQLSIWILVVLHEMMIGARALWPIFLGQFIVFIWHQKSTCFPWWHWFFRSYHSSFIFYASFYDISIISICVFHRSMSSRATPFSSIRITNTTVAANAGPRTRCPWFLQLMRVNRKKKWKGKVMNNSIANQISGLKSHEIIVEQIPS